MANDLTGDYDVVMELSLGTVNRVIAMLHSVNRLPHSMSLAVDDRPDSSLGAAAIGVMGAFGSAIAEPRIVKKSAYAPVPAGGVLNQAILTEVDSAVNWRQAATGFGSTAVRSFDFSYLSGVAQLQLGPPTMQLPAGHTDSAEIHTAAMIRYFPDTGTLPLSAFMRGEIVTTFGVKSAPSGAGTNIVVDLSGPVGNVHFNPFWSETALGANDKKAINLALSKILKNNFVPSSTPMPSNLLNMDFKGLPDSGVVAVMMNVTTDNNPSPDSAQNVFLSGDDQFAVGVNGDIFTSQFAAAVNAAIDPFRVKNLDTTVNIDYGFGTYTFHIYTDIRVGDATVQLIDLGILDFAGIPGTGQILLTIPVQVTFGWKDKPFVVPDPTNFNFTINQIFTLTLNGAEVGLQTFGAVDIEIPAGVPGVEANNARSQATALFNNAWSGNESQIQQQINQALSADTLQSFLKSLMNPPGGKNPQVEVDAALAYTSFEITPSGIVLHGTLSGPDWPAAEVEFENDAWAPSSKEEYRALNSWIPGGTIEQFQWTFGQASPVTDSNRFVSVNAQGTVLWICLSITGSRISASGPVSTETVDAGVCNSLSMALGGFPSGADSSGANYPLTVVAKPVGTAGLEILGHSSPWAPKEIAGAASNLLVHFPGTRSFGRQEVLTQALAQSGRSDTAAAIVTVLTPEQVSSVKWVEGLLYADDAAGWEKLLEIHSRPATVLLDPEGRAVWRHDGEIAVGALADALHKNLVSGRKLYPRLAASPLQVGQRSPNFWFEFPPGEQVSLRKLVGKPVVLVFFKSSSAPSVGAIRSLHRALTRPGVQRRVIVAVNDGEDGQFARGLAAGEEGCVVVVPDPARQISQAYRIVQWPTIVLLDAAGLVRDVRFGMVSEPELQVSVGSKPTATSRPEKES